MEPAATKSWMDSWTLHLLGWVGILGCSIITLALLVVGIVKAAKGRGHDLWISMACAMVVGIALAVALAGR